MLSYPRKSRALVLSATDPALDKALQNMSVTELDVTPPQIGEVVIEMEAAPCNPSDLLTLQGLYGVSKNFPTAPGWEGCGRVISSGGGILASRLLDKRVACGSQSPSCGTWSQYFVTNAKFCVPIPEDLPTSAAATFIVNPLTAVGLMDRALERGATTIVQTAAASQLGRMIATLCQERSKTLINIVRREEQVQLLKEAGNEFVLNSNDDDFKPQLKALCKEHRATVAFDAVGGSLSGTLFNYLEPDGVVIGYGALAGESFGGFDPRELIFKNKSLENFYLGQWMNDQTMLGSILSAREVVRNFRDGQFETQIFAEVNLDQAVDALMSYSQQMTRGKVLIKPNE